MEPTNTLDFTITGHLEGCCIRFGGEVVSVFDCYRDAENALKAGQDAPRKLAETLARKAS